MKFDHDLVTFVEIGDCPRADQEKLRDLRNEPEVRKAMYTDHIISVEEHNAWLSASTNNSRVKNHLVYLRRDGGEERELAGFVAMIRIDALNKNCHWAFYLSKKFQHRGIGFCLEFKFLDMMFLIEDMEKVNCEVIDGNNSVVRMHAKFGFEQEGFLKDYVVKDGARVGVHVLGLTRARWRGLRAQMSRKLFKEEPPLPCRHPVIANNE